MNTQCRIVVNRLMLPGVMMLVLGIAPASAADSAWTNYSVGNSPGGFWEDAGSWDNGVPLAGVNAYLNGPAAYTVNYTNPVNYKIGSLTISNSSGASNIVLNINTNGFSMSSCSMYTNAAINVNVGGVVTNSGAMCSVAANYGSNVNININGGRYYGIGPSVTYGTQNAELSLNVTDGLFYWEATSGFPPEFKTILTQSGGVVSLNQSGGNTAAFSMYTTVLSGGVLSNNTAGAFNLRGGSLTITNDGKMITSGLTMGNSFVWNINGGMLNVTGSIFRIGDHTTSGSRFDTFNQRAGFVIMTNPTGIILSYQTGAGQTLPGNYAYNLSGGTCTMEKITFGTVNNLGTNYNTLALTGGRLNLGAGGMITNGAPYSIPRIFLSGGTVAAQAGWSSYMDMVLTNTPRSITFDCADTNGVGRNITLTGKLSGIGGLIKTGGGALYLNGSNTYSGGTIVSNGMFGGTGSVAGVVTIVNNAVLTAGSTGTVGVLNVTNLALQEGAVYNWNYDLSIQDVVNVSGTLNLSTNAVVNVSAVGGATMSDLPEGGVLFTFADRAGASSTAGWVVNGAPGKGVVRVNDSTGQVLLNVVRGTVMVIR